MQWISKFDRSYDHTTSLYGRFKRLRVDITNYVVNLTIPKTVSKNDLIKRRWGTQGTRYGSVERWRARAFVGCLPPSLTHFQTLPLAPSLLSSTLGFTLSLFLASHPIAWNRNGTRIRASISPPFLGLFKSNSPATLPSVLVHSFLQFSQCIGDGC